MDKNQIYNILADNFEFHSRLSKSEISARLDLISEWLSYFRKPLEIYKCARVYVSAYFRPVTPFNKQKYFDIVVQIRAFRLEDDDDELIKEIRSYYFLKHYFNEDLEILTETSFIFPRAFQELQKHSAKSQKNK